MNGTQKAWVAAAVGGVVGLLSTLSGALSAGEALGDLDAQTWLNAVLAAIVGSGIGGSATYRVPNKPAVEPDVYDEPDEPDELDDLLYRGE